MAKMFPFIKMGQTIYQERLQEARENHRTAAVVRYERTQRRGQTSRLLALFGRARPASH
ncbi:MAG: hypothetical protein M1118_10565 [Chloroflexi bacterium]|nr:hypothetical protein [Chloroflexota bacterium]